MKEPRLADQIMCYDAMYGGRHSCRTLLRPSLPEFDSAIFHIGCLAKSIPVYGCIEAPLGLLETVQV